MQKITEENIINIAESFVSAFNGAPWNDNWTIEQAIERLTDIYHTPKFHGGMKIINGKIAAVILGSGERYYDGIHFQILEFWVDKDMHRQGIGGILLDEFTEYLKGKGIYQHFLITLRGAQTEGFYQKHGYETDTNLCIMQNKNNKHTS